MKLRLWVWNKQPLQQRLHAEDRARGDDTARWRVRLGVYGYTERDDGA